MTEEQKKELDSQRRLDNIWAHLRDRKDEIFEFAQGKRMDCLDDHDQTTIMGLAIVAHKELQRREKELENLGLN